MYLATGPPVQSEGFSESDNLIQFIQVRIKTNSRSITLTPLSLSSSLEANIKKIDVKCKTE